MRELNLLQHVYSFNRSLPPGVTIPPGDDMGAVRIGGEKGGEVLVTVDQVADGVHVRLEDTPLAKVGRKAITRNLSDVAAMAAAPVGAVVAACLPRGFGEDRANALFDAMRATAQAYHCPLVGGDIAMWDNPLLVSVTVFAEAAGIEPVLRRGARDGDVICVSGSLGGSLERIVGRGGSEYVHHLDFEPRLTLARALASDPRTRPHCMIDLSDGLAQDLPRLCRAADAPLTAVVDVARLPVSPGAAQAAQRDGRPAWEHALGDGEDYELCFTVAPDAEKHLPHEIDGVPITRIGLMQRRQGDTLVMLRLPDGAMRPMAEAMGWEHQG